MGRRLLGHRASLVVGACACGLFLGIPSGASADRAYELVTAAGGTADVRTNQGGIRPATPDGNHVCFASPDAMVPGQPPVGGTRPNDAYCAHRGAGGWAVEWISQPRGRMPHSPYLEGSAIRWITDDGGRQIFTTDVLIDDAVPVPPGHGVQVRDGYVRASGATQWITGPRAPADVEFRMPLAASRDLKHAVFAGADGAVYEWTPAGQRAVSVDGTGATVPGRAAMGGSTSPNYQMSALPSTVSADGSRIFFEAQGRLLDVPGSLPAGSTAWSVYVRENATTTRLVSPRTGAAGTDSNVFFVGASADGTVAYVVSVQQLTSEPITGAALYRYADGSLTLVEDGLTTGSRMERYVLAVSEDGSTVFFSGTNVLAPTDGRSLYVHRSGVTTRITAITTADQSPDGGLGKSMVSTLVHDERALRITADGSAAVFRAEADQPGIAGIYRWSAVSGLEVISKDASGTKVAASMGNVGESNSASGWALSGRAMSDDGRTIFFETASALDAVDTNGRIDVYEWRDGAIKLVSPGNGPYEATYLDNSADGRTVFFTTYQAVLPAFDTNGSRDLYAARVGGGFPDPPTSTIGATPAAVGPGISGAAPETATSQSHTPEVPAADPSPAPGAAAETAERPTLRIPGAASSRSGKRIRVAVRGSESGELRLVVRRRGHRGILGRARTTIAADERRSVTVRLNRKARALLRREGDLAVTIAVTLRSDEGALVRETTNAALRRSQSGAKRSKQRARNGSR